MEKMTLEQEWNKLDGQRSEAKRSWEKYASWTLPYLCPPETSQPDQVGSSTLESIGARSVNHLSNRVVMTLFRPHAPFFRLSIEEDAISEILEAADAGDQEALDLLQTFDKTLAKAEKQAMAQIDAAAYRTRATLATKFLIVTGNAMIYDPPGLDPAQAYGPKDYVIKRDIAGTVLMGITRDQAAFSTFNDEVREALQNSAGKSKTYENDTPVNLYTRFEWDGKLWNVTQAADSTDLDKKVTYDEESFPWIVLTWNLKRGDNYGRGLVEDYAGAFHVINVLTQSLVNMAAISGDIKQFVDPSSVIDVAALNSSPPGSYHSGREGDLWSPDVTKMGDKDYIVSFIDKLERDIGMAFLLNSSIQRQAERVTAEEIRYMAQELETANGGVYSHLAATWQMRQAKLLLKDVDIDLADGVVFPKIVTGMDSLSRNGDLENIRLFVADLALLEAVPEEVRRVISPERFAQTVGIARGVDYTKFLLSVQEIETRNQQEMQQQQQLMQAQASAQGQQQVATELAKQE